MKALFPYALRLGGIACVALLTSGSAPSQIPTPKPEPIELSGRLQRPVKWTPQLEILPAGQVARIDLEGRAIEGIKEGTSLRVRGVVRTSLHRGGTEENPSLFPPQWMIRLEVMEVEILKDWADVLK